MRLLSRRQVGILLRLASDELLALRDPLLLLVGCPGGGRRIASPRLLLPRCGRRHFRLAAAPAPAIGWRRRWWRLRRLHRVGVGAGGGGVPACRAHGRDRAVAVSAAPVVVPAARAVVRPVAAAVPAGPDRVHDLVEVVAVLVVAKPGPVVPLLALAVARVVPTAVAERLARGPDRVVLPAESVPGSVGRPADQRAAVAFRRLVEQAAELVVAPGVPVPVPRVAGGLGTEAAVVA